MKIKPVILLVEDSKENLQVLKLILDRLNVTFIQATSGESAIKKAKDVELALAIVDVQLPGMDGFDTMKRLHKQRLHKQLPVIFISGIFTQDQYKIKGIQEGAVDFIAKPVVPEILIGKVTVFINLYIQKEELRIANEMLQEEIQIRKLAQEKTKESEIKFRSYINKMLDGFAFHKIVTDKKGKPVDYIFLEINKAFEKLTGLKRKNVIGNKVTEVIPGIEKDPADWIGKYGKVALEEKEIRFESYAEPLNKWYSVAAYSLKKGYFAAVFEDVTDQKNAQKSLETLYKVTSTHIKQDFFDSVVSNICKLFDIECAIIGKMIDKNRIIALSMQLDGKYIHDYQYELKIAPCDIVVKKGFTLYPSNVSKLFPQDNDLIKMKGEGYIGIPLKNKAGKAIGVLCGISRKKLIVSPQAEEAFMIMAVRASMEIERINFEDKLAGSEVKYRTLVESSPLSIIVHVNNKIVYINKKAVEIMAAKKKDDLIGKPIMDYVHSSSKQLVYDRIAKVMKSKKALATIEEKFIRLDKKIIDVEVSSIPILYDGENAIQVIFNDITKRKQGERALTESETRYRNLFENMIQGVLYQKADGTISGANKAALDMFGLTLDQMLNWNLKNPKYSVVSENESPLAFDSYPAIIALRTGKPVANVIIGVLITGKKDYLWLNVNAIPQFKDKEKKPYQVFVTLHNVTERKKSEKLLKEREFFLSQSQAVGKIGSYLLNTTEGLWTSSDTLDKLFGINKKFKRDVEGWLQIVHPEHRKMMTTYFAEEVVKKGNPFNKEYRIIRKNDQEERWVHGLGKLEYDDKGELIYMLGTIQDITNRKKSDEKLQLSNTILKDIGTLVLVSNTKGEVLYCSPSVKSMTGYNVKEVLDLGWWELSFWEKDEATKTKIKLKEYTKGKGYAELQHYERKIKCKNGSSKWFIWQNSIGPDGLIIGVGHDITIRKKFEEALNKSKVYSETILSTMPDGMDIVKEDGTIMYMNKAFNNIFGNNVIGKKCFEIYKDDKKKCKDCPLNYPIKIGETHKAIVNGVAGGNTFEVNHTGMLLDDGSKAILEVFRDITEQEKAKDKLINANTELNTFVYKSSHDLKAPLASILGLVNIAKMDVTDESALKYLGMIADSIDRLDNILMELLRIVKITEGVVVHKIANLNEMVADIIDSLKHLEMAANVTFQVNINQKNIFYSDRGLIIPILQNLITNALMYKSLNGKAPYISIEVSDKDQGVQIIVKDNGQGIRKDVKENIFEMFFRGNQTSKGSGLGLFIVKRSIEKLGGKIKLASVEGKGSTFTIYIPSVGSMVPSKKETIITE